MNERAQLPQSSPTPVAEGDEGKAPSLSRYRGDPPDGTSETVTLPQPDPVRRGGDFGPGVRPPMGGTFAD
jgi:hypothetical protein